jgi:glyoxylase-like metal-dependent hydrolase (beta-lactamase superfamily II)
METVEPELIDVAPGLWLWQVQYREWPRDEGWDGKVVSTCVESGGEIALLDPLAPANESSALWDQLSARPPKFIVILNPDHVRDVDFFTRRYNIRAFGPKVFYRNDVPETELEYIYPGLTLPGGLVTLYDGRNANETPLWLPEQRTIVFADALTAPNGELLVWSTPWHQERVLPALRDLLKLPFERVIVSHGEPVHTRTAFERALELPPLFSSSFRNSSHK